MTGRFEELRDWAIDRATDWALAEDGRDRLAVDGLAPAWSLRIEAFNLLMPLVAEAAGQGTDFGTVGWRGRLKRRGLDRAARLGALRASSVGRRADARPVPVAYLAEFATPSGLEPMLSVARALPSDAGRPLAPDPRIAGIWRRAGARPVPLLTQWRDELAEHRRVAGAIREPWAALRADPRPIRLDGVDLTTRVLDRLEPLATRSVPWLAVERLALARRLDALAPRWLVLASDQHRLGRQAVELAAERGIRTLVLQHGLPQYRIGFLPVVADAVATWSAASDAWFVDGGTDPARLRRLGNPRLDRLRRLDRAATRAGVETRVGVADRRVLLTLSPNEPARNAAIVDLLLAWLATEPSGRLVVKLHPGDGRWDEVRERIAAAPVSERATVAHREPLYPLLAWADLVVLHRSTVAVEAMAAGTPVAIVRTDDASPDDALPPSLDLPEVATGADIAACLAAVADDEGRRAFIGRRREALEMTTGPLDGRSAERIAAYLTAGSAA
jgi:glycosyltransferase involved in cell wall biosynthesis